MGIVTEQRGKAMNIVAQVVGIAAVLLFLLSYRQKDRKQIIVMNVFSRCLYILQYLLLGALSGAILDILGTIASIIAGKKDMALIRKHPRAVMIAVNVCIALIGGSIAIKHQNPLDVLPVIGVLFHTSAFWISDERWIRRVSLVGSPFWLVYNFLSHAYGSALGDALAMFSMVSAIVKYEYRAKN